MSLKLKRTFALCLSLSLLLTCIAYAAGDAPFKYDPPITMTNVKAYSATMKFPEGDTPEDNAYLRSYRDNLGINVELLWSMIGGDTDQKMNITIASGEIPDVMMVNARQLKQLVESDMVADLTQVYDEYASDLTRAILSKDGGDAISSCYIDGKMFAVPSMGSNLDSAPLLWLRTDWLEKLGMEEPKTLQDVLDISTAFATKDPDGNGENDTYGMALHMDLFKKELFDATGLFNSYGAYPVNWIEDGNGGLVFGGIQPECKEPLMKLAEMVKNKEIDNEWGAKNTDKEAELLTQGKIGMFYGLHWNIFFPVQGAKDAEPTAEWRAYPLLNLVGGYAKPATTLAAAYYFVVRKEYEHPEAAIRMVNMFMENNLGPSADLGTYGVVEGEGGDRFDVWTYSPYYSDDVDKNVKYYIGMMDYLSTGNLEGYTADAVRCIERSAAFMEKGEPITDWSLYLWHGPDRSAMSVINLYMENKLFNPEKFVTAATATMAEKQATLDKLMLETYTKIIYGNLEIDAFDTFVSDWKKLGGDQITAEVNEWYAAR